MCNRWGSLHKARCCSVANKGGNQLFPPTYWAQVQVALQIPWQKVLLIIHFRILDWPWNQICTYREPSLNILLAYLSNLLYCCHHAACLSQIMHLSSAYASLAWYEMLSLSYLSDWVPNDSTVGKACELPMSPVKTIALVFQLLWCAVNLMRMFSLFLRIWWVGIAFSLITIITVTLMIRLQISSFVSTSQKSQTVYEQALTKVACGTECEVSVRQKLHS